MATCSSSPQTKKSECRVLTRHLLRYNTSRKSDGQVYDAYMMITPKEFELLMELAPKIINFPDCLNQITTHDMVNGRMKETNLSSEELVAVEKNNETAYNQLAMQCTYCGGNWDMEVCHCHRYDCRQCESENFCSRCQKLRIRPNL